MTKIQSPKPRNNIPGTKYVLKYPERKFGILDIGH